MFNLDDGYSFGIGAFETMLVNYGKCILLNEHLERLHRALDFFKIDKLITEENVNDYIIRNNIVNKALKIMVSNKNTIYTVRDNPYTTESYKNGFRVILSNIKINETSPLTYIKSLNYGLNVMEKRKMNSLGYDEVMFLNTNKEISECSTSNVFFIRNGQIITPKIECGLLDGVVRRYILSNYNASEEIIKLEDIYGFSEAFLTNSLMGVMPINRINDFVFQESNRTVEIMNDYLQKFNINGKS